jgi:hypothetical protein
MRSIKPILLASALAFCAAIAAGAPASAAPVNGLTASIAAPQTSAAGLLPVEQVAQRRYNRNRHGHRHRARRGRHVHFYQGYWYAVPWWLGAAPYQYNRCERWRRECRQRWGRGANYRGCMRHHGCRP